MTDTITIPESVLLCIVFGACLLAVASFFTGYWFGRWKEGRERGR